MGSYRWHVLLRTAWNVHDDRWSLDRWGRNRRYRMDLPSLVASYPHTSGTIWVGVFSGSLKALVMPEPVEQVERKVWYDPAHRYLCAIKHITDQETGEEYYPELASAVFVENTDVISVNVERPSDGAVSFGSQTVVLHDPTNDDPWASTLMRFQRFEYGEDTASEELGQKIARTMDLKFTP